MTDLHPVPPSDEPDVENPDASQSASPAGSAVDSTQNVAMLLGYEGTPFMGWQVQPHGPTVQGALEEALRIIFHRAVPVYGSGRTDTGVHALNQVTNVRLPEGVNLRKLQASINGLVGPFIVVKALLPVSHQFHARHSARGKVYRYHIHNQPYPCVFGRDRSWWIKRPLDTEAMRAGALHLLGTHDFSAFRAQGCEARSPVRTLRRLALEEGDWPDGTLRLELEASGFLQHMARIITGTLVAVGQGKLLPDELSRILAERRRQDAHATAPGRGLHLVRVFYDLTQFPQLRAWGDQVGHMSG